MAYTNAKGAKQYTMKEKIAYHTKLANNGYDSNGEKLTLTQRVRHANCATRQVNKLNRFMKTGERFNAMRKARKSK